MSKQKDGRDEVKLVGNERITVRGLKPGEARDGDEYVWVNPEESKVGHEDIDTDDRRKDLNRSRHSSYRK